MSGDLTGLCLYMKAWYKCSVSLRYLARIQTQDPNHISRTYRCYVDALNQQLYIKKYIKIQNSRNLIQFYQLALNDHSKVWSHCHSGFPKSIKIKYFSDDSSKQARLKANYNFLFIYSQFSI